MSSGEITFDTRIDSQGFKSDANKLGSIVKGLGIFAVIQQGLGMVANSLDAAISRYDALNKFPKVMEQMGYGADVAEVSMQKLSDGIQGLPTTLDEITQNTQRLTIATGSLETGTDSALALNNAFLASGASTDAASRGMQQYIQMLSTGKVDLQSWKSLQETMPYALQKTAEAFGYTGATAQDDFYNALKNSEITMTEFNAKLIELDGGLNGFAEVAKTATGGIGTAMTNLKNRTVIGVTAIVAAFDQGLSTTKFKSIENVIVSFSVVVKKSLEGVAKVVGVVANNLDVLAPIVVTSMAGFAAYKSINLAASAYNKFNTSAELAKEILTANTNSTRVNAVSQSMLTKAKKDGTSAEIILAAAEKQGMSIRKGALYITDESRYANEKETLSVLASSGALSAKAIITGVLSGTISIATGAQLLWNAAMSANPIGVVIIAITALVAAIVGLVSWINKVAYANDEQLQKIDDMKDKQEELATSIDESTKSYEENLSEVRKNQEKSQGLLTTLSSLVDENGRLTGSHDDLTQVINDLNNEYTGLNLAYDEENGYLSANQEEIKKYIEAQNKRSELEVLQKRRNELLDEEAEIQAALKEIEEQRSLLDPIETNNPGLSNKVKALNKLEKEYTEQHTTNSEKLAASNNAIKASNQAMIDSTIAAYESSGKAMTSNGVNIRQLAETYHTTTDQIIADMKEQNISLDEWATNNETAYTSEGASVEQMAQRWGMAAEDVYAEMDLWGENLDEFSARMEDTHTSAGKSIKDLSETWGVSVEEIQNQMAVHNLSLQEWSDAQDAGIQDVINGYKELPTEMDISLEQMIAIMHSNNEKMAVWKNNMAELSKVASDAVVAEMERLGPASNEAVTALLESPEQLAALENEFRTPVKSAMDGAETEVEESTLPEATSEKVTDAANAVNSNQELENAMKDKSETLKNTLEETDFTQTGNTIAQQIINAVKNADMSGIGTAISAAILNASTSINGALVGMQNTFKTNFTSISTSSTTIVTQMMNKIVSTITSSKALITASVVALALSFTTSLNPLTTQVPTIAQTALISMNTTIIGYKDTIYSSAKSVGTKATDGITDGIKSGKQNAYNAGREIGKNTTAGMVAGLDAGKQSVYDKATEIANTAANKIKEALKIHSPSRVMEDLFGFVVKGMVVGLVNEEQTLYSEVDALADGVTTRIGTISEEMAAAFNQKIKLSIDAKQVKFSQLPQLAAASSGTIGGTVINNYFEQTNISPEAASPAENSRAIQNMLTRSAWSIP